MDNIDDFYTWFQIQEALTVIGPSKIMWKLASKVEEAKIELINFINKLFLLLSMV
jgi:hypothetical protein